MTWENHKALMIDHFLYLRQKDARYARSALETYTAAKDCPYPDIASDVHRAWRLLRNSAPTSPTLDSGKRLEP